MKRVFVINGPATSGKDTFIEIVRRFLSSIFPVLSFSAVDEVKQDLKEKEGWDGVTKDAYWRLRMHAVKMEMVADNNRPTRYLLESIQAAPDNSVIFLHIREAGEIEKLLAEFPEAKTIHLTRETQEVFDNPADALTLEFMYDFYINNHGSLDDLAELVRKFIITEITELPEDEIRLV
jgi:guanylate kinase